MDAAAAFGLAGLILLKEAGLPIPVPGDLVVIGAGVAAANGGAPPGALLLALVVASVIGGGVQFALLRSVARPAMLRLLARLGAAGRVDGQIERLRRSGAQGVALARMTPGVRIVAIAASALAALPAPAFLGGLVLGNGVFIAAHFALGFALGEPVVRLVGGALGPLALVGLALAVLGAVAWALVGGSRGSTAGPVPTMAAWADACCPACLALAVAEA